ncbi:MAG TPA: cyclase family protein [Thermoanaerobaculia bacterium]|nr:cyclase family protein [Thermoanaerobaculia bacterium]
MGRRVELSHTIAHGTATYPGLPGPEISDHLTRKSSRARYAPGTEFQIGRISMVGNTGTYLDSPFHRYPGGADLSEVPLDSLADLPGVVVRAGPDLAIGPEAFEGLEVRGRAVLIHTGWDARWGTGEYFADNPHLTADAAARLAAAGAALVGIDSVNIDRIEGGERPAHSVLLAKGIPIVEHLTGLSRLPDSGFRFFAVPPRIRGFGTFPVRAFALV